ncbi:MAG: UvrB/UvrC motif-containing protein [Chloroflexota bacterium]
MLCQECRKRPATVHLTKIINGQKTELHLCQQCAQEKGEFEYLFQPVFSFPNLLAGLMGSQPASGLPAAGEQCPHCGQTYNDFAQKGRLGCSECYTTFAARLDPLLKRIHGHVQHTGKVPRRTGGLVRVRKEVNTLRNDLQRAIENEEFEKAAKLRDQIRELERKLE